MDAARRCERRGRGQCVAGKLKPLPTELVYKENRVASALVGGGFGKERGKGCACTERARAGVGILCVLNVFTHREW